MDASRQRSLSHGSGAAPFAASQFHQHYPPQISHSRSGSLPVNQVQSSIVHPHTQYTYHAQQQQQSVYAYSSQQNYGAIQPQFNPQKPPGSFVQLGHQPLSPHSPSARSPSHPANITYQQPQQHSSAYPSPQQQRPWTPQQRPVYQDNKSSLPGSGSTAKNVLSTSISLPEAPPPYQLATTPTRTPPGTSPAQQQQQSRQNVSSPTTASPPSKSPFSTFANKVLTHVELLDSGVDEAMQITEENLPATTPNRVLAAAHFAGTAILESLGFIEIVYLCSKSIREPQQRPVTTVPDGGFPTDATPVELSRSADLQNELLQKVSMLIQYVSQYQQLLKIEMAADTNAGNTALVATSEASERALLHGHYPQMIRMGELLRKHLQAMDMARVDLTEIIFNVFSRQTVLGITARTLSEDPETASAATIAPSADVERAGAVISRLSVRITQSVDAILQKLRVVHDCASSAASTLAIGEFGHELKAATGQFMISAYRLMNMIDAYFAYLDDCTAAFRVIAARPSAATVSHMARVTAVRRNSPEACRTLSERAFGIAFAAQAVYQAGNNVEPSRQLRVAALAFEDALQHVVHLVVQSASSVHGALESTSVGTATIENVGTTAPGTDGLPKGTAALVSALHLQLSMTESNIQERSALKPPLKNPGLTVPPARTVVEPPQPAPVIAAGPPPFRSKPPLLPQPPTGSSASTFSIPELSEASSSQSVITVLKPNKTLADIAHQWAFVLDPLTFPETRGASNNSPPDTALATAQKDAYAQMILDPASPPPASLLPSIIAAKRQRLQAQARKLAASFNGVFDAFMAHAGMASETPSSPSGSANPATSPTIRKAIMLCISMVGQLENEMEQVLAAFSASLAAGIGSNVPQSDRTPRLVIEREVQRLQESLERILDGHGSKRSTDSSSVAESESGPVELLQEWVGPLETSAMVANALVRYVDGLLERASGGKKKTAENPDAIVTVDNSDTASLFSQTSNLSRNLNRLGIRASISVNSEDLASIDGDAAMLAERRRQRKAKKLEDWKHFQTRTAPIRVNTGGNSGGMMSGGSATSPNADRASVRSGSSDPFAEQMLGSPSTGGSNPLDVTWQSNMSGGSKSVTNGGSVKASSAADFVMPSSSRTAVIGADKKASKGVLGGVFRTGSVGGVGVKEKDDDFFALSSRTAPLKKR
ncbi:hypothetical protein BJ742DRAFT_825160 [Cladochytrium replicatum]|nr:hypothetical protein BJ742DRAFT_825160 [Cladochytrium replicatum]